MQNQDENSEFNDLYRRFDEAMNKVDLPDKGQLMSLIASHSYAKPSHQKLWIAVAATVAALVVATFAVTLFFGGKTIDNVNMKADAEPQPSLPSATIAQQEDSALVVPASSIDTLPLAMIETYDDDKVPEVTILKEEKNSLPEIESDKQYADNNSDSVINEPLANREPVVPDVDSSKDVPAENSTNQYPKVMRDSRSEPNESQKALQNCRKRKNDKATINGILNQNSKKDRDINFIIQENQMNRIYR